MFYPDLNAEQRHTVWNTFINKLEAEKSSMQVKYAVKEYLRSSEIKGFKMNGREIRNGENINLNYIWRAALTILLIQLSRLPLRWLNIAQRKVKAAKRCWQRSISGKWLSYAGLSKSTSPNYMGLRASVPTIEESGWIRWSKALRKTPTGNDAFAVVFKLTSSS
jgi:hypothetical protein